MPEHNPSVWTREYVVCDNCGEIISVDELPLLGLDRIDGLAERLTPGSVVPVGQCNCGALVYPVNVVPAIARDGV